MRWPRGKLVRRGRQSLPLVVPEERPAIVRRGAGPWIPELWHAGCIVGGAMIETFAATPTPQPAGTGNAGASATEPQLQALFAALLAGLATPRAAVSPGVPSPVTDRGPVPPGGTAAASSGPTVATSVPLADDSGEGGSVPPLATGPSASISWPLAEGPAAFPRAGDIDPASAVPGPPPTFSGRADAIPPLRGIEPTLPGGTSDPLPPAAVVSPPPADEETTGIGSRPAPPPGAFDPAGELVVAGTPAGFPNTEGTAEPVGTVGTGRGDREGSPAAIPTPILPDSGVGTRVARTVLAAEPGLPEIRDRRSGNRPSPGSGPAAEQGTPSGTPVATWRDSTATEAGSAGRERREVAAENLPVTSRFRDGVVAPPPSGPPTPSVSPVVQVATPAAGRPFPRDLPAGGFDGDPAPTPLPAVESSSGGATSTVRSASEPVPPPPPVRSMPVAQLGLFVVRAAAQQISHFVVRLEPASLGRVEITLRFKDDGRVAASFRAQQGDALQVLRAEGPAFARLFAEHGIELAAGGLDFGMMEGDGRGNDHGPAPFEPASASTGDGDGIPVTPAPTATSVSPVGLVDLTV